MMRAPHRISCVSSDQERIIVAGSVTCPGEGDVRTGKEITWKI